MDIVSEPEGACGIADAGGQEPATVAADAIRKEQATACSPGPTTRQSGPLSWKSLYWLPADPGAGESLLSDQERSTMRVDAILKGQATACPPEPTSKRPSWRSVYWLPADPGAGESLIPGLEDIFTEAE
jgi:hypothetical protein